MLGRLVGSTTRPNIPTCKEKQHQLPSCLCSSTQRLPQRDSHDYKTRETIQRTHSTRQATLNHPQLPATTLHFTRSNEETSIGTTTRQHQNTTTIAEEASTATTPPESNSLSSTTTQDPKCRARRQHRRAPGATSPLSDEGRQRDRLFDAQAPDLSSAGASHIPQATQSLHQSAESPIRNPSNTRP